MTTANLTSPTAPAGAKHPVSTHRSQAPGSSLAAVAALTRSSLISFVREPVAFINPDGGGFSIFAGLEQIIEYIENMHFSATDIVYLCDLSFFDADFLDYLADYRFTGNIRAFREGTIMYPS